ncbi:NSS family neurotransmitter:Na+ symporter [Leucobacter luti]|uniref:sodium-dependent transporter n=1 Tax=Leucobacter luti TaxID=340320 RepID=UPI001044D928|nr:sodium-dependent transporter [Leucobacter luti]MCW2287360.1 NSS family neurotransmitter:Na+ symporter [Leucobacter luti]TCK41583.1 NSS family neurotransmitter:Na+ symporter [Leucobacter luti]
MTQTTTPTSAPARAEWTGQFGFIISAIGSAVGLGNIWRFPGVAYENGGGAFLIPYIVALLTAGIPILFLDYAIGHRFRGSAPLALRRLAGKLGEGIGWFQVMICVFIAIYYTAVLAWASSYFVFSFDLKWGEDAAQYFTGEYLQLADAPFTLDFVPAVLVPLILMWIVALVVLGAGVVKGVQRLNMIAIPLLVAGFLVLVVRALFLPGAADGLNALFTPDFAALADPSVWVAAYSQIFFSLSVAFGIMMTYSSYRRRRSNMTAPGLVVAFGNSSFEILAGVGVFATLGFFAHQQGVAVADLEGLKGVGLAFMTFPAIATQMPGGEIFGALFFGALTLAGLTSMISIMEVILAGVMDKFGLTRKRAVYGIGGVLAVISVVLFGTSSGLTALDTIDNWANNIGIVASAVVMTITVLWIRRAGRELSGHLSVLSTFKVGRVWLFCVSVLGPVVLGYMLIVTVIDLVREPFSGYDGGYLLIVGWGSIALMIIGSVVLTLSPWRYNPDRFTPWPALPGAKTTRDPVPAPPSHAAPPAAPESEETAR